MKGREFELQKQLTNFIASNWPDVQYRSDLGGIRLPWGLARKVKEVQQGKAWPDLFIAKVNLHYAGLFIELKFSRSDLLRKDGSWRNSQHILRQRQLLVQLRSGGYCAEFVTGFRHGRELVEWYLGLPEQPPRTLKVFPKTLIF